METRELLQKTLNQYTSQLTPGQTNRLGPNEVKHYFNVYLNRNPNDGSNGTVNEYGIYENHPDAKQLFKDLSMMRKNTPINNKTPLLPKSFNSTPNGQGGVMDDFASSLAQGASRIGAGINNWFNNLKQSYPKLTQVVSNVIPSFNTKSKGMRTDRNNNPTAMTTDVAATGGLVPGVDYVQGDPFSGGGGRVYYTAKLLGDPISTTIKAIDRMGFYTQSGKPRWTYTNAIPEIGNWSNLNYNQKANIIAQMYHHEGGNGSLIKGIGQGGPDGAGGPIDQLGKVTTNFGQQTKDTDFHRGVDIANHDGTPIPKLSNIPGTVIGYKQNDGDYGNQLQVKNDDGNIETYSHLKRSYVKPGQRIMPFQDIAAMGHTGNAWSATGGDPSHLHYEITDAYNRLINPAQYLK